MTIAIFTPSQNPYSETFIQAHKLYLKGKVCYYYGSYGQIRLEGESALVPRHKQWCYRIKRKWQGLPHAYVNTQSVLQSLRDNDVDVILVEYGTHAHALLPLLQQSGLPFMVHFHGYDASRQGVIARCGNYKTVFKEASAVMAVSQVMETTLLDLGCPKDKLVYNVYGPRPEFHNVMPTFAKPQFVAIGRFTDKKAPYYTIMAFKQVARRHPEAQLLMAGEGALRNMCQNLVKQYGLEEQVRFLGVITPERYRELLEQSLAFVQHSITASNGDMEGTPLAVLEASAAGLPVIATKHAGIPDVIVDGETGLLCQEHDIAAMAKHMEYVLEHKSAAKQMGKQGKTRILEQFSLKRHIEVLQELLETNCKNKKNG